MKHIQCWCFLVCCLWATAVNANAYYGQTITTNNGDDVRVMAAVRDMAYHLQAATGKVFTIQQGETNEGIYVYKAALADSALYKGLSAGNADAFLIRSNGVSRLDIIAYGRAGLLNGIYTYLDTLGFRWYQPGQQGEYIPRLSRVTLVLNMAGEPSFALRTFFGTFGTPRNPVVDKEKKTEQEWEQWATRNRLGGSYVLKGHMYNDFLWRNAKALKEYPEYMALTGKERAKVNTAAKFCVSNEGFRQLFIADLTKQLRKAMETSPQAAQYIFSVEPSDGDGYCRCEGCKAIGNISNQVFYLANEVAKAFQKVSAKAFVNLYAYHTHAKPPGFGLEDNVIVQLIPYGYQKYAAPEEMIKQWQAKSNSLFIYDYYGLPLNYRDLPHKAMDATTLANKINYWKKLGIKGVTLETTYSVGAVGPGLYLYSRLMWNSSQRATDVLNEYYRNCYGPAADAVQQAQQVLMEAGSNNRTTALAQAYVLIKQAPVPDADRTRGSVVNYKAYLHYIKLWLQFKEADAISAPAKADTLMQFVYGTFSRKMVHPMAFADYMLHKSIARKHVATRWNYLKPTNEGMLFGQVKPLSNQQIEMLFNEDLAELEGLYNEGRRRELKE